jgi:Fe-S-cluster containining protein
MKFRTAKWAVNHYRKTKMIRPEPPFARTTCGCSECVACCRRYPGHLIPGDLERIAEHLNLGVESAKTFFWASRGATVVYHGQLRRIGTITPRYSEDRGACVFLTDDGKCRIHAVAPFGCAYADTHMSMSTWQERGAWALKEIMHSAEYTEQRATLTKATCGI